MHPQQPAEMPFFPLSLVIPRPPAAQHSGRDDPPARVQVALAYLAQLTQKTMARAAANELSIEVIDGQKLTTAEEGAQEDACHLLAAYFRGSLKPTPEEKTELDMRKHRMRTGTMMQCPACSKLSRPDGNCYLCRGTGGTVSYPLEADPS